MDRVPTQTVELNLSIDTDGGVDPARMAEWFERFLSELSEDEMLEGWREGYEEFTGATFMEVNGVSVED